MIDADDANVPTYIPGSQKVTLTAQGVLIIAKLGYLPDISKESIQDKSKADKLAKSLALLQASWLVGQCIERLACQLPLTLLEINTLAHVLCALFMYCLWWNKPLDVFDPTVLKEESIHPLCAAMWMFSTINTGGSIFSPRLKTQDHPEIERLVLCKRKDPPVSSRNLSMEDHDEPWSIAEVVIGIDSLPPDQQAGDITMRQHINPGDQCMLEMVANYINSNSMHGSATALVVSSANGRVLFDQIPVQLPEFSQVSLYRNELLLFYRGGFGPKQDSVYFKDRAQAHMLLPLEPLFRVDVDPLRLSRWRLALQNLEDHFEVWNTYGRIYNPRSSPQQTVARIIPDCELWEFPKKSLFYDYVSRGNINWPETYDDHSAYHLLKMLELPMFLLASAAYGALHVAAWNEYFPTYTEHMVWRLSAAFIAASGLFYSVFVLVMTWLTSSQKVCFYLITFLLYGTILATGMLYVFARFFLVFEAFLQPARAAD